LATGFRVLATALFVLLGGYGLALASQPLCLECHPAHYRQEGSCTFCHQGRADTRRKEIAHDRIIAGRFAAFTRAGSSVVEEGRKTVEKTACRRCHIVGGKGNRYAANLDWAPRNATAEELFAAIREPALFMPDFHFSAQKTVALVNTIYAAARTVDSATGDVPVKVHFVDPDTESESTFEKKCGSCHRLLTAHLGGLGVADVGPNLSGLLTAFYPATYPDKKAWTVRGLEDWLKNPRKLRQKAQMIPVPLKRDEWQDLEGTFLDAPVPSSAAAPVAAH